MKRTDPNYNCTSARQEIDTKLQTLLERPTLPDHVLKAAKLERDKTIDRMCNTTGASIVVNTIVFKKCLCNYTINNFNEIMTYYNNYKKGNLPFPGSISEQPAQIIEIFTVLDHLYDVVQNDMKKESK